jgi:2-polyprenyl-3-methyl-5-hydroxy-6-metoxy-1,4-benzoquinol methylase
MMSTIGIETLARTGCPFCHRPGAVMRGSETDRIFGAPGTWSVRHCAACRHAWLDPVPAPSAFQVIYGQYHTHAPAGYVAGGLRGWLRRQVLASSLGYGHGLPPVGYLLAHAPLIGEWGRASAMGLAARPGGRLLEVGAGSGGFLVLMRGLGWDVTGIEPDEVAARGARSKTGVDVIATTLERACLPPASFDAITMSHVLEHLPDWTSTLGECHRLLRPGGRIAIITPNVESLLHRWFGRDWRGLEVPRHLDLFSVTSLRSALTSSGFRVDEIQTLSRSAGWVAGASLQLRRARRAPSGVAGSSSLADRLVAGAMLATEIALGGAGVGEEILAVGVREG